MVRANRAGRKSQTRRIMNPQPVPIPPDVKRLSPYDDSGVWWACSGAKSMVSLHDAAGGCPYGWRGDRLWQRETWASAYSRGRWGTLFAADMEFVKGARQHDKGPHFNADDLPAVRWRPSIFLPRWACRNVYEVTHVRVQRLQDISEEDARAEGVEPFFDRFPSVGRDQRLTSGELAADSPYRAAYAVLWDEINADRATWKSNPWCWAISYKPAPLDAATRATQ